MDPNYPKGTSAYQQVIHMTRYAKFLPEKGRRETWRETVDRYVEFMANMVEERTGYVLDLNITEQLRSYIWGFKVMPSMRALMTAGPALARDDMAAFNCSYIPIKDVFSFSETLFILMCGTGVGFSVERQYINGLPVVPDKLEKIDHTIVVGDSKEGWANALFELLNHLYCGEIPQVDYSLLRPKGAILKTFGGRSSGPEPLRSLFQFVVTVFGEAIGRKLTSLECHDIVCKIGEVVVSGGVRRSALISLSNLSDDRMRDAKMGNFGGLHPQRYMANNSSAYTEKPEIGRFMREWQALYESQSGERGIFNRDGAKKRVLSLGTRDPNHEFGTNPCGEILLRPYGLCNLSEVVIRHTDDLDDILVKCQIATIIGTMQSLLTNFRYVREDWKKNAEEERLLGVSLTGLKDHPVLGRNSPEAISWLAIMRKRVHDTNKFYAEKFGITSSAACTTVKPSGTVSQLVDCSSGIHHQYAPYYIRRLRGDREDPTSRVLREAGIPHEADQAFPLNDVFTFYKESPNTTPASFRNGETAVEFMDYALMVGTHWTDHNPSVTVFVKEHEWMEVGAWVYKNFDSVCGMSFLPYDSGSYVQAPYEEISEIEFIKNSGVENSIDWSTLPQHGDGQEYVTATKELACVAGVCSVDSFGERPSEG